MAGKHFSGDGVPPSLAGMSKNQLHDIMSQMKTLIEQNRQQARQILIQNPVLTRALFQAQIMLGMVQAPQTTPAVSSTTSQISKAQAAQPPPVSHQKPKIQPAPSLPAQTITNQIRNQQPDQTPNQKPNQAMVPRKPHPQPALPNPQLQPALPNSNPNPQLQPALPNPNPQAQAALPNPQPQSSHTRPLQPLQQPKAHLAAQSTQMPIPPQSNQIPKIVQLPSQLSSLTQLPQHSVSQPASLHLPSVPSLLPQLQQPLQNSGNQYLPLQQSLQPPLPPQMRGQMPGFPPLGHGQMGLNLGFQHPGGPPMRHSQHMFHSGEKAHAGMGSAFPQGKLPHPPNQPLPPSFFQGGKPHLGMDYNQGGNSRLPDRGGPHWTPGVQENLMGQLQRPPPFLGQVGPGGQPSRPDQQLTPELEKTLLQQVMSLTPEQINSMPPEHRNQIIQLQQMLRQ